MERPQFEYKTESLVDWESEARERGGALYQERINELGLDGWELVDRTDFSMTFRREIAREKLPPIKPGDDSGV